MPSYCSVLHVCYSLFADVEVSRFCCYSQAVHISASTTFYRVQGKLRPRGYKTFFMLNSTEHEISTAHKKLKYRQIKKYLALSLSDVFIMLINVKMAL